MAENDLVIVGNQRAVVLYKPPASISEENEQLLTVIDVIGPYKDGFVLAFCRHRQIPELRAAGAEVIVVDADANHYAVVTEQADQEQVLALLDRRVEQHESDLAIAEAGRDRNTPGSDDGSASA
jgi:hypothetical protein